MDKNNVVQLFDVFTNIEKDFNLEDILKRFPTGNVNEFVDDLEAVKEKVMDFYNNKSKVSQSFQLLPLIMSMLHLYNSHQDFIKEIYDKVDKNWSLFEKEVIMDEKDNPHLVEELSSQIVEVTFKFLIDVLANDTGKNPKELYDALNVALTELVKDCAKDLSDNE